ncbi:mono-functional DNA-alkylating methyl methanesulfonate N-term-domain-containing protein [Xylariales sp. PMI_506]|nr:mono-functional DNA-alkylating methyl methanesulfonate N-term-domain-containing protein [Xylariales sp. PMI_506]
MALQTNVIEGGQWVTRTVEPRELFRQTSTSHQAKTKKQPPVPPDYGILTKTVIDSPVIRWVLPVQLRSSRNNDVAFIGNNFVQICELDQDVQLQHIARKQDFGSRIRNACVIGAPSNYGNGRPYNADGDDTEMANDESTHGKELPPQLLALVLECNSLVFLYLDFSSSGEPRFVSSSHDIPSSRLVSPGYHMAVDPSSRYLTLGCPEELFVLFELESMETLRVRHSQGRPLEPVKSNRARAIRGIIQNIDFLHPGPNDDYLIILMIIVVNQGVCRLATYDWELDDNLEEVLQEERSGTRLDPELQIPLLVVPSTVRYSFLVVTERGQAAFVTMKDVTPQPEWFNLEEHGDTDMHIGRTRPLWTAWSRPSRLPQFHLKEEKDVIYLAREDGILCYLEVSAADGLETTVLMREVECNINTAFACLYEPHADVLIVGGDCGPGAIWSIQAKKVPRKIGTIPNWSPTVDLATTHTKLRTLQDATRIPRARSRISPDGNSQLVPDRIFACSGRGKSGTIAEYRHGVEAKIGLQMDCGVPIRQCWAMHHSGEGQGEGFHLLLALPNKSEVLYIRNDLTEAFLKSQDEVPYDLASSTLAALESDDEVIQVTTSSITIITATQSTRHLSHDIDDDSAATISCADVRDKAIALAIHSGSHFRVKLFALDGLNIAQELSVDVDGEVTCLAVGRLAGETVVFTGIWSAGSPMLAVYSSSLQHTGSSKPIIISPLTSLHRKDLDGDINISGPSVEALTSIVLFNETSEEVTLSMGTRSGEVFTVTLTSANPQGYEPTYVKFGYSSAHVYPLGPAAGSWSILVGCNLGLTMMTSHSKDSRIGFEKKYRVWLTDIESDLEDQDRITPVFSSVARLGSGFPSGPERLALAMIADTKVYIAELQSIPKPLLRHLPVKGTPEKVIYHRRLDALIVAASQGGRSSLQFIDPETGEDLSSPTDSDGNEVESISGLGEPGSSIKSLTEWQYEKGGRVWAYVVVSLARANKTGQVLVITAERHKTVVTPRGATKIHFYTRYKKSYDAPVWSIATDTQGLLLCAGKTVHYEVLDRDERRLKPTKTHELPSPAAWMEVIDGVLHVATSRHSLEILDYSSDPHDDTMTRLHSDDYARCSGHCIEAVVTSGKGVDVAITLLSDYSCGLWGLWASPRDDDPLRTVFGAELQSSIRRFGRTQSRPLWEFFNRENKYGNMQSSSDGSDIVGLGIDGSLQHFTVLNADVWRLLRFIQVLALSRPQICPFSRPRKYEDDGEETQESRRSRVFNRHADGDILQRCLDMRALEDLIRKPVDVIRFKGLLNTLEEGKYTQEIRESDQLADYFSLAYDILRYYLAPVL